MSRAAGLAGAFALAAAAGCASFEVPPLAEEPRLAAIRGSAAALPVALAVAAPRIAPAPPRANAGPFPLAPADAQDAMVAAFQAAGVFERVRALAPAQDGADPIAAAWLAGDDLVLDWTVTRLEVGYEGTNVWFLPNLLMWVNLVWPAWFVPDEDYDVRIEAQARLIAVNSGREVWRGPVRSRVWRRLSDFDRGMVFLATLRVPSALDDGNWSSVAATLRPEGLRELQVDLVEATTAGVREVIQTPAYRERTQQTLALAVGCSTYYARTLPNLKFPGDDSAAVARWLTDGGLGARQVRLLRNEAATRAGVLGAIRTFLAGRARPRDRVVLYFSGYAGPDGTGGVALYPYDADPSRPGETTLSLTDLAAEVRAVRAGEVLIIIDAGLGGGTTGRWGGAAGVLDAARIDAQCRELAAAGRTALVWACGPGEGAAEANKRRNGLLTLSWIRASERARDVDADGRISVAEVFRDVQDGVQMHALLSRRKQAPRAFGAVTAVRALDRPPVAGGAR